MKGTMIILRPNDDNETKPYNKPPTADELRTAVGGYLEPIPWFNTIGISVPGSGHATLMNCVAFCDEEGKNKNKPLNECATDAWAKSVHRLGKGDLKDYLVGNVVVLFGDKEFMEKL